MRTPNKTNIVYYSVCALLKHESFLSLQQKRQRVSPAANIDKEDQKVEVQKKQEEKKERR